VVQTGTLNLHWRGENAKLIRVFHFVLGGEPNDHSTKQWRYLTYKRHCRSSFFVEGWDVVFSWRLNLWMFDVWGIFMSVVGLVSRSFLAHREKPFDFIGIRSFLECPTEAIQAMSPLGLATKTLSRMRAANLYPNGHETSLDIRRLSVIRFKKSRRTPKLQSTCSWPRSARWCDRPHILNLP
jgi:hypothetical protein